MWSLLNQKYPNLGVVTANFTDGSVSKTINSLGPTEFDSGDRVLVSVNLLGQTFLRSAGTQPLTYPDGSGGECMFSDAIASHWIWLDGAWGF